MVLLKIQYSLFLLQILTSIHNSTGVQILKILFRRWKRFPPETDAFIWLKVEGENI